MRQPKRQGRRKTKSSKSRQQRAHAKRRARERFGLDMSDGMYNRAVNMIRGGESTFIFKQSNSKRHHLITLGGHRMVAVYDPKRGQTPEIRTFLTVGMSDNLFEYQNQEVETDEPVH